MIDLCSAEARVIISTGSTKFHPVAIFLFAYFQDGRQSLNSNLKMIISAHIYSNFMIIELISIKSKAISTLMTLEEFIGGQGQRSSHFMGLVRLEKASNVARDLFYDYDYSQYH